jgi:hypothetical protein
LHRAATDDRQDAQIVAVVEDGREIRGAPYARRKNKQILAV